MVKPVVAALVFWLFTSVSFPVQAIPQSFQDNEQEREQQATQFSNDEDINQDGSPLTELGTEYHNSIALLQNRFRIDYEVDEITMIFFREFGSAPIVLVRPDGSKIFQSSAEGENIFWFDNATYDMISLKNPTPGPWQAVGQIVPGSRVMVISDLALHVDPLPNIIFSGEILKQTAYLTNGGVPIDYSAFRDVVELTISLSSTNNPNFNNFGAPTETVAYFEDNGKGMDERPLDGVFTGQFNLAIADGEWIPTFTVSTPMFSREQVDPTIMLLTNPIKIDVELAEVGDGEEDGGGEGYHKLKVDAQREYVDMSTLLIDGKVRYPSGDIQNFSITEMSSDVREYLIGNAEYGVYRVKLTAYGNTTDGREFILDIPEYSFLTEEPVPVVEIVEIVEAGVDELSITDASGVPSVIPEQAPPLADEAEDEMSTSVLVSLIVGINLFILIVGGGLIWWLTLDKKPKVNATKKSKKPAAKKDTENKVGFFAKIFKRKPKETTPVEKKPQAKAKPDPAPDQEFKDLAIPDD